MKKAYLDIKNSDFDNLRQNKEGLNDILHRINEPN